MSAPGCDSSICCGEQRGEEVAVDELAVAVDEEAAVGVAVPRDPEVGALAEDLVDHEAAVLGQERVRLVVGELAVGLPVAGHQLERAETARGSGRPSARPCRCRRRARSSAAGSPPGRSPRAHALLELGTDVDVLDAARRGRRPAAARRRPGRGSRRSPCRPTAPARPRARASRPCRPSGCARRCTSARRRARASRRGNRASPCRPSRRRARARPRPPSRRGSAPRARAR